MSFYRPYIITEWYDSIKNHKYAGADLSIFYTYVMSPICNKLVNYFPIWLAPNLITFIGFIFVILTNILINYFSGWDGKNSIPGYISIICGLLYYLYHILDNIDGKQARRTNNSTPLGMLFDHGCDSITTFFLSIILCSIMKLNSGFWYGLFWFFIAFPFFMCTWEQNITGFLYLPVINGVSEGSLLALIAMIFTGIMGQDFWVIEVVTLNSYTYHINEVLIIGLSIFSILTFAFSLRTVIIKNKEKAINSISDFIVISIMFISMMIVLSLHNNSDILKNKPKLIIYLYGFMFGKLLIHLMIAHIAHSPYEQYRWTILSSSFILAGISIWNHNSDLTK